ncbi:Deoxyuridine 5'-triphosphate nucleotidohydrolase [Poriferisphaera corsica]|uniref:Deoxyuridine 5'-triphosphate nucleotidohydrolase n=1 Tax=Poriferisphaera corsica TaxID=2528020 RepID=A0A517YY18_9BACT|nr:Deoxyuridine 5'-triphosphate nucleotidohydrolase [Poriferisphaera corsica]
MEQVEIETVRVAIKRLDGNVAGQLPTYQSEHAAGMDVYAHLDKPMIVKAGEIELVPTGFAMALPIGWEAQIRPRSGLAVKHGIGVPNGPGTIDADYRGEVKVALINHGKEDFIIENGMRVAQMIVKRVPIVEWLEVDELPTTARGVGGFGHTGH